MTAAVPLVERLAEVLAAHRYRDVLGDYEAAPFYKHFGCSCGWEQNIAGMGGWRSWVAAHEAHAARALLPVVEQAVAEARGEALREATNDWQWGQWTVLTEPIKATSDNAQRIIGAAQAVTDWLRVRADAIATTEGAE